MSLPVDRFPSSRTIHDTVHNGFFLSRIFGFSGGEELQEALEGEEGFEAFEAIVAEQGREEEPEDPEFDLPMRLLSIPLYLPQGFVWEIEFWDNGEDAGVEHYLHLPDRDPPLRVASIDAHPRLPTLRWVEAVRLFDVVAQDPRNAENGTARLAPLLLWATIGLGADEPAGEIEERLAAAWQATELLDAATAARIASASAKKPTSEWRPHPELGWLSVGSHSYRRDDGEGWSEEAQRAIGDFLRKIAAAG